MSDEEVIYDEFGEIVFDEDGNINEKLLDDYQVNPDGIEQGDAVIVAEKGLRFFHVRKFKVIGTAEPRCNVYIIVRLLLCSVQQCAKSLLQQQQWYPVWYSTGPLKIHQKSGLQ